MLPERTCGICWEEQNAVLVDGAMAGVAAGAGGGGGGGVVGSSETDVTNPYEGVPCGCVYCYVCLASRLEAEEGEGWVCLRCGEVIRQGRVWSGDVIVEGEEGGGEEQEEEDARILDDDRGKEEEAARELNATATPFKTEWTQG